MARADPPPRTLTQLTHTTEGTSDVPTLSADGRRLAFRSTHDLTGSNPEGNPEHFLFDITTQTFTQLTDSTAGSGGPPVISADGSRVAFHSQQDLTGANPDGNAEIFLFDTRTHTLTQLTDSTGPFGSGNLAPVLNADGTRLAFHANLDLTGENPDGTFEIFLYDTTTLTLSQLTSSAQGDSSSPAITAEGTRIAFESYQDLTGDNADGNAEIFLFDTTTHTLTQLTHSTSLEKDGSFTPSITADGSALTFSSNQDLTGGNADGNYEIFLLNTTTQIVTQLTHTTDRTNTAPRITAAGRHVTFTAESTIGDAFTFFLADTVTQTLTPLLSAAEDGAFHAALNATGSHLVFASTQDLAGSNPDGSQELFVFGANLEGR